MRAFIVAATLMASLACASAQAQAASAPDTIADQVLTSSDADLAKIAAKQ